jgi:prophage regulatory protein
MKFLRIHEVMERTGLSRPTIRRLELAGEFPPRRRLGYSAVGWYEEQIDDWIAGRPVPKGNATTTKDEGDEPGW